ncbi:MAG: YgiT-type zinc finger protein [bacterium]|nr:YgiT-type zinc finger protein [bacterium]
MKEQRCLYCNGQLVEQTVTRFQEYNGHWYMIENLPALVCEQCGEQFFTPAAHDLVVDIITNQHQPDRVEQVSVFNAAKAS